MSLGITDTQNYTDIADAIRAKNGSADTYKPDEMATAISNLPSGGGGITVTTGTFTPATDITGVAAVTLQGDFSDVIAVCVSATEADVQAATKTMNSIYLANMSCIPPCHTNNNNGYTGYEGYYFAYNTNNQSRNGLMVEDRALRIKNDYSELIIGTGASSNLCYVAGVTYTYYIYRGTLPSV